MLSLNEVHFGSAIPRKPSARLLLTTDQLC